MKFSIKRIGKKLYAHKKVTGILAFVLALTIIFSLEYGARHIWIWVVMGINMTIAVGIASQGEIINQKSGQFNITIEGIFLISALVAVFLAETTSSWVWGFLGGTATGTAVGVLYGGLITYGRGNQLIVGLGITMMAGGLVSFLIWTIWGQWGAHGLASSALKMPNFVIGGSGISYMIFPLLALPFLTYLFLYNTSFGLAIRSCGNNPWVADTCGIRVLRVRLAAAIIGCTLAGVGGAYLSLGWLGYAGKTLAGGMGFIALAAVMFGAIEPGMTMVGAAIFGMTQGITIWAQSFPPFKSFMLAGGQHLMWAMPYILVIVLLAFVVKAEIFGKIGEPYRRE